MNHEKAQSEILDHLYGEIDANSEEVLLQHVGACPECERELRAARAFLRIYRSAPALTPPADAARKALAVARKIKESPDKPAGKIVRLPPASRWSRFVFHPAWGVAALFIVVFCILIMAPEPGSDSPPPSPSAAREILPLDKERLREKSRETSGARTAAENDAEEEDTLEETEMSLPRTKLPARPPEKANRGGGGYRAVETSAAKKTSRLKNSLPRPRPDREPERRRQAPPQAGEVLLLEKKKAAARSGDEGLAPVVPAALPRPPRERFGGAGQPPTAGGITARKVEAGRPPPPALRSKKGLVAPPEEEKEALEKTRAPAAAANFGDIPKDDRPTPVKRLTERAETSLRAELPDADAEKIRLPRKPAAPEAKSRGRQQIPAKQRQTWKQDGRIHDEFARRATVEKKEKDAVKKEELAKGAELDSDQPQDPNYLRQDLGWSQRAAKDKEVAAAPAANTVAPGAKRKLDQADAGERAMKTRWPLERLLSDAEALYRKKKFAPALARLDQALSRKEPALGRDQLRRAYRLKAQCEYRLERLATMAKTLKLLQPLDAREAAALRRQYTQALARKHAKAKEKPTATDPAAKSRRLPTTDEYDQE